MGGKAETLRGPVSVGGPGGMVYVAPNVTEDGIAAMNTTAYIRNGSLS